MDMGYNHLESLAPSDVPDVHVGNIRLLNYLKSLVSHAYHRYVTRCAMATPKIGRAHV